VGSQSRRKIDCQSFALEICLSYGDRFVVNSMRNRILCLATVLALSCGLVAAPGPSGGYSVIKKIPIEGKSGWDYLAMDEVARRLYVSHGTAVEILNLDSGERLGAIPTAGVHGNRRKCD
jgi:hypothetical protein